MAAIKWRIKLRRRVSPQMRNRKFRLANKNQSLITDNKAAWLDHNGQFSSAIFSMSAALLIPLLSSEYRSVQQHRERFDVCVLSLAMVAFLAGILKVFSSGISGKELPQNKKVNIYLLLTLLTGAFVTHADLAVLSTVDKSYWYFTPIPVLQTVLLAWLSYLDLQLDQTERSSTDHSTMNETMIKNCFKVSSAVTSACYTMQAALLFGNYLKAINFSEGAIHYSLLATFLTSAVGCFAMVMTSSPLPFQSELVHFFLGNVPMVMSFLVWVAAAILSTKFLPGTILAFAGIVPVTVEILVYLIWKTWGQKQATAAPSATTTTENVEVDSTFGGVIPLSIGLITMIYVNFGREEYLHDYWYMIMAAVFCLLSSITFGLMRLLFPFRAECSSAKRSVCTVLTIGPLLLGFALILIENLRALMN